MADFIIGIDLGTTNSVLAYCPLNGNGDGDGAIKVLGIPQLTDNQTIETLPSLASFNYLANPEEAQEDAFRLPWHNSADEGQTVVGSLARTRSAQAPDRTVSASKSWLSHAKVDRRGSILPWSAPAEVAKISPVVAAKQYLKHLVAAWQQQFPQAAISDQIVVLTVPASFDPVARELTREAALAAGLPDDLVLLEEPQAALYAWLEHQGDRWRKQLKVGDSVLVCDVGGGTTDLTLIGVEEEQGELSLRRVAVGDHLLVGGDNMDLATAYQVSARLSEQGSQLNPWQTVSLWHACRTAKEHLLSDTQLESYTVSILGRGSKLIGGTISTEVHQSDMATWLLDGFFPLCELSDRPQRRPASGFQEIGLPYESDPAITRHIAAFVNTHCYNQHGRLQPPQHVLFNGGVFKAQQFQQRLLEVMSRWVASLPTGLDSDAANSEADDKSARPAPSATPTPVRPLRGVHDLDFAVARGACFYGLSKQTGGLRIRGGTGSSYYVGIETSGLAIPGAPRPLKALCVVPFGMEEGTDVPVHSGEIGLVVGQPVSFRFFSSKIRKDDQPGLQLNAWDESELTETEPLIANLPQDASDDHYVPVTFESRITELGIFELWCVSTNDQGRWKLEFSVREEENEEAKA